MVKSLPANAGDVKDTGSIPGLGLHTHTDTDTHTDTHTTEAGTTGHS